MFEIFSPDSFRRSVENASGGKATILYDSSGNPSFMAVIPKMTLGDLYPETHYTDNSGSASDPHPAFVVQDETGGATSVVDQIFISQYHNTIQNSCAVSLPNQIPYHGDRTNFETYTANKGSGWHIMNALEYGLLWSIAMSEDKNVKGNTYGLIDDTTEMFNFSGDDANKCNLYELELSKLSCVTDIVIGETVTFDNGGSAIVTNTYRLNTNTNSLTTGYMVVVQANAGSKIEEATTFIGSTVPTTGTILQVRMHETTGAGPISWTHNHNPWGVWMFGAGREFIDSFWLGPDGTYTGPIIQCAKNNYRDQTSRDIENLTLNYNELLPSYNHIAIGYQPLDVDDNPTTSPNNLFSTSWHAITMPLLGFTTNAISSASDADKLLFKTMGLWPVSSELGSPNSDYRDVWLPKNNIRWTGDIHVTHYTDSDGRMHMCRGGWQTSDSQSTNEKTMHSLSFTSAQAYSTFYERNSFRFRSVYIPAI